MPSDNYAHSGVDTDEADRALARLLLELQPTQAYGPPMEVGVGSFAAVIRVGPLQLALTTDGVGTKLLIAELAGRYEGVGIDCIAMNVNDLICVGAKPIAMLDYIAVERADPEIFAQIGRSLAEGARQAGISIVGGETAQVRDMLKGAVEGHGLDLVGMALGVVPEGGLIDGSTIQPGDSVIGIESSGLHSNGYSLARAALLQKLSLEDYVEELGSTLVDALLEPVHIYVPQAAALNDASIRVRAMAHITGDGLLNLRRVEAPVGFEITDLPETPAIFQLIEQLGEVDRAEMRTVFNMGVGFAVVVAEADTQKALELIRGSGRAAWRIGHAVADPERKVLLPGENLVGTSKHFTRAG